MSSKAWLVIILAIIATFMVLVATVPSNEQTGSTASTEAPASPEEGLWISISCASPYHYYIELRKDGLMDIDDGLLPGENYAESTRKGHYSYHFKGQNLSIYATVQKIDSSNLEDELTMEIYGKKLSKKLSTFYPGWDLELEATGAEDKALLEAEE